VTADIPDYYKILGVNPKASTDEIKNAFREKARFYHPDANPNLAVDEKNRLMEAFKKIVAAYEILKDPNERQKYDSNFKYNTTNSTNQNPTQQQWQQQRRQEVQAYYQQKEQELILHIIGSYKKIFSLITSTNKQINNNLIIKYEEINNKIEQSYKQEKFYSNFADTKRDIEIARESLQRDIKRTWEEQQQSIERIRESLQRDIETSRTREEQHIETMLEFLQMELDTIQKHAQEDIELIKNSLQEELDSIQRCIKVSIEIEWDSRKRELDLDHKFQIKEIEDKWKRIKQLAVSEQPETYQVQQPATLSTDVEAAIHESVKQQPLVTTALEENDIDDAVMKLLVNDVQEQEQRLTIPVVAVNTAKNFENLPLPAPSPSTAVPESTDMPLSGQESSNGWVIQQQGKIAKLHRDTLPPGETLEYLQATLKATGINSELRPDCLYIKGVANVEKLQAYLQQDAVKTFAPIGSSSEQPPSPDTIPSLEAIDISPVSLSSQQPDASADTEPSIGVTFEAAQNLESDIILDRSKTSTSEISEPFLSQTEPTNVVQPKAHQESKWVISTILQSNWRVRPLPSEPLLLAEAAQEAPRQKNQPRWWNNLAKQGAAVTLSVLAVMGGIFGTHKALKILSPHIPPSPIPETVRQHPRPDAEKTLDALNRQRVPLKEQMNRGGVAAADTALSNNTNLEYYKIDTARDVEPGTTHREIDAISNLTDGKDVYTKAVNYYHQQKAPSQKDATQGMNLPTPQQVAQYLKTHHER
jgi:curved DNA-binding protein CbpA